MAGGVNHARALEPGRAPSLAERAYLELRDRILTLRMPPGAPINEDQLSAQLEVGRTPLRDAIKRLEAETLVVIFPRRGTFVSEVNITDHGLIADVRRQLEGHAAERAADWATDAERDLLTGLAGSLRRDPKGRPRSVLRPKAASMEQDAAVHRSVYECTHNRYLFATLSHYYNLSLRIWYLFLDRLPEVDHAAEHIPMLEAICAGDGQRAREFAVAHVDHFEQSVRAAL